MAPSRGSELTRRTKSITSVQKLACWFSVQTNQPGPFSTKPPEAFPALARQTRELALYWHGMNVVRGPRHSHIRTFVVLSVLASLAIAAFVARAQDTPPDVVRPIKPCAVAIDRFVPRGATL